LLHSRCNAGMGDADSSEFDGLQILLHGPRDMTHGGL
jgi:hypothetical protein